MIGPIKLQPVFKERIWGGDGLARLFGKPIPSGVKIGESWELADLPEGQSTVGNGDWNGLTMRQLFAEHGRKLGFTAEQIMAPFGLLIKFLDANDILSVQVHPDAQACQKFPGARLKTECWYILNSRPGAYIYKGLVPGVTREKFSLAIKNGHLEELMQKISVKSGDFHHLPAGTVHALGAGVMVAEIQTPSDTTYRVYDWGRVDSYGKGRELHIDQALASIHFNAPPQATSDNVSRAVGLQLLSVGQQIGEADLLLACEYFSVVKVACIKTQETTLESEFPVVAIMLRGRGQFNPGKKDYLSYSSGDTILFPSKERITINMQEPGECLLTCLGPKKPE